MFGMSPSGAHLLQLLHFILFYAPIPSNWIQHCNSSYSLSFKVIIIALKHCFAFTINYFLINRLFLEICAYYLQSW